MAKENGKALSLTCPSCGGTMELSTNEKTAKCPYCGHEFRYRTGYYNLADPSYINLQEQWRCAHEFGYNCNDNSGAWTRVVTCPSCGRRCEVGYKCTMRAVSRKVKEVRDD